MDFFDNAVSKAKEALDIACKKTGEVVTTSKQKFDVATIESKRSKDFEALGKIYFEMIKDEEIEDFEIKDLVLEIKDKNEKIDALKEEINNAKNKRTCPVCKATIDKLSVYCNICGAKLEIEND